jgi:murein DD-endopeptidase MepM/ murein hydrolase activator NlpD
LTRTGVAVIIVPRYPRHNMRKNDRRLTILVVPHNDSAPLTLSFPRWLVPSVLLLFIGLLLVVGYVLVRYQQLSMQYYALSHEQQVDFERGRGMRSTILTQQDDVKALTDEVRQVQSEMDSILKLSQQVRQLLGLPQAVPPPQPDGATPQSLLQLPGIGGDGGAMRAAGSASPAGAARPSMLLAWESEQSLQQLHPAIPWAEKELQYLASQALQRLGRIDPSRRGTFTELEAQLKLLNAAPTLWPVRGRITSNFGWRPALFDSTKREFHTGLDIGVWYFTPVHATRDGIVTYSGWRDGYGNTVEITHDMGYMTLYGHNFDLTVKAGQRVKAGDVIARSGQTGYANGPHVHYEVRLNGVPLDPLRFLDLKP